MANELKAIISDIHSNLEAFSAVLYDIYSQKISEIICLGDIIGYGPCPLECLDMAMDLSVNLLGNHEEAVKFGPIGFNPKAKKAIEWTKDQINLESEDPQIRRARWRFIGNLKPSMEDGNVLFVHGSPRDPVKEYVFPTDVLDPDKLRGIFAQIDHVCFNGHTHTPGVMTEGGRFIAPKEQDFEYTIAREKVLINVGSVGQPRDGDNRACYVIFDGKTVRFHRVAYDVRKTVDQLLQIEELPEYLAYRLREGR